MINSVIKFGVGVFGLFLVTANSVYADDYISPDQVEVTTPIYKPDKDNFHPRIGAYSYTVRWQGIPAATVESTVDYDGIHYYVNVMAKTYSGIDIFYKLRFNAKGIISAQDFQPIQANIDHRENSRHKQVELDFLDNGEIRAIRNQKGKPTETLQFNPNNFTLDPFSAAFLARSLNWQEGETKSFDTFNGRSRYLISLTAKEKIQMKVNGVVTDVWVITPTVSNLTSPSANKKLREAKIYVTADSKRDILMIKSSVFIGTVTTKLDSFVARGTEQTKVAKFDISSIPDKL